jgi:hypothetical protein
MFIARRVHRKQHILEQPPSKLNQSKRPDRRWPWPTTHHNSPPQQPRKAPKDTTCFVATYPPAMTTASITTAIEQNVRPLLDVVDRLRELGIDRDIPLPQIAVMGDQSSGKSSVLEALSGVPFPRGSGLVTKCATELRMKKSRPDAPWCAEISLTWDRPQPDAAGVVGTPSELGAKIARLTEILVDRNGGGKDGFESEHSILIELSAPDVPDLTVIDLPGIVRTTVGDQPKSVIDDVMRLIRKYLEQERTIILAVIPCNVDIATVDILEKARGVDPGGVRTIGVLTKPDMIGVGAENECVSIMQGVTKPLKLGYTMLKNRSQQDIDNGLDLAQAKEAERRWFDGHEHFKALDPALFGVDNLAARLTDVLVERIKCALPDLVKETRAGLERLNAERRLLPPPCTSDAEAKLICSQLLAIFEKELQATLDGNPPSGQPPGDSSAVIRAKLHAKFMAYDAELRKIPAVFLTEEFKAVVAEETDSARGVALSNFLSHPAFTQLLQRELAKLTPITRTLVAECCELLQVAIEAQCTRSFGQHSKLNDTIKLAVHEQLAKYKAVAMASVCKRLDREQRPFTVNHYYAQTLGKLRQAAQQLEAIKREDAPTTSDRLKEQQRREQKPIDEMLAQLELAEPPGVVVAMSRRGTKHKFLLQSFHHVAEDLARKQGEGSGWCEQNCTTAYFQFGENNYDLTVTIAAHSKAAEVYASGDDDGVIEDLVLHGKLAQGGGLTLECPEYGFFVHYSDFSLTKKDAQPLSFQCSMQTEFNARIQKLGVGTHGTEWRLHAYPKEAAPGSSDTPRQDAVKFVQEYSNRFASNDELANLVMQMSLFAYSKVRRLTKHHARCVFSLPPRKYLTELTEQNCVQVAIKRIADDVPMIIDQDFITEGISDTQTVREPRPVTRVSIAPAF